MSWDRELLAALHHVQSQQAAAKDNMWQVVQVLADNMEQLRVIRDYCERPMPLSVPQAPGPHSASL